MHLANLERHVILSIVLMMLSSPLIAQEFDQDAWIKTKEKWGQLLYCQRIYKMPEVKTRLYDFDIEQCDKASQLADSVVAKYPKEAQTQLKNQAERHAYMLSKNTSEPYLAVPACREYCQELADIQDKRSDR